MTPMHLILFALLTPQESERLVATIPDGCDAWAIGFSADGKVAAYIAKQGDQLWAAAGEWKSKLPFLKGAPGPWRIAVRDDQGHLAGPVRITLP